MLFKKIWLLCFAELEDLRRNFENIYKVLNIKIWTCSLFESVGFVQIERRVVLFVCLLLELQKSYNDVLVS